MSSSRCDFNDQVPNKMCRTTTVKTKSLGSSQQSLKAHDIEHKRVTMIPSKKVVLLDEGNGVEITVRKTKGQKHISPTANISPEKKAEKKRSVTNNNQPLSNWGNVFRQNILHREQSSKHSEDKEVKRNINTKKQQKSTVKHPTKSEEKHLKAPCCSSILVRDCAVQCEEVYNSNIFAEFNPVYMLSLMKQLQDLVNKKDKRTCEIFTEMEQILQKIPALRTKAESSVPLKESSKKMKTMSYELEQEKFMLERERLQSEILERDEQLKEVDTKYLELEKMFTQQLNEATREKNEIISLVTDLRQQIENKERTIKDLKIDLNKQTEIARKNSIDSKYLTMEINKLSMLFSYKDTQIIGYQNIVKELQNQITKIENETYMKEEITSSQVSLIHTGHACSSPTSSFSDDSNKSLHDLADVSSINSVPASKHALKKDAPTKDFELVSLLDGESSCTIMPVNEVTNDKGSAMQNKH